MQALQKSAAPGRPLGGLCGAVKPSFGINPGQKRCLQLLDALLLEPGEKLRAHVRADRAGPLESLRQNLRALGALESYSRGTNFTAWLARIAKNLALNHVKKGARETASDFTDEAEIRRYGTKETELPFIFDVAAKVLDEQQYEIVMLCHVAGYKRREVAGMLSLPIGTVTWKNNEALKKLKEVLKKEGGL